MLCLFHINEGGGGGGGGYGGGKKEIQGRENGYSRREPRNVGCNEVLIITHFPSHKPIVPLIVASFVVCNSICNVELQVV